MNTSVRLVALLALAMGGSFTVTSCSSSTTNQAYNLRPGSFIGDSRNHNASNKPRIPSPRVNDLVLGQSNRGNTRVIIDVADQKGYLLVNERVAVETPVSTARPGKHTPRGSFRMGQRVRTGKVSTIYGVEMPYWMRLNSSAYGLHAGYLPGYPASAGCVRLPYSAARMIYDNTQNGTRVNIYSSWDGA